jgi:hypothetical protein
MIVPVSSRNAGIGVDGMTLCVWLKGMMVMLVGRFGMWVGGVKS